MLAAAIYIKLCYFKAPRAYFVFNFPMLIKQGLLVAFLFTDSEEKVQRDEMGNHISGWRFRFL